MNETNLKTQGDSLEIVVDLLLCNEVYVKRGLNIAKSCHEK